MGEAPGETSVWQEVAQGRALLWGNESLQALLAIQSAKLWKAPKRGTPVIAQVRVSSVDLSFPTSPLPKHCGNHLGKLEESSWVCTGLRLSFLSLSVLCPEAARGS